MIDHDNILPHSHWLENMIRPLIDDNTIMGSGVLRFDYDKKMSFVDRYSALFGGYNQGAYYPTKHYKYYVERLISFITGHQGCHVYYEICIYVFGKQDSVIIT